MSPELESLLKLRGGRLARVLDGEVLAMPLAGTQGHVDFRYFILNTNMHVRIYIYTVVYIIHHIHVNMYAC